MNRNEWTHYVWCEVRDFVFVFPADADTKREAQLQAEAAFGDMGFEDDPEVIDVEDVNPKGTCQIKGCTNPKVGRVYSIDFCERHYPNAR